MHMLCGLIVGQPRGGRGVGLPCRGCLFRDIRCQLCRFVRTDEDDSQDSWEVRMARRYYTKLFKEYAIADLSRYKVRMRNIRIKV